MIYTILQGKHYCEERTLKFASAPLRFRFMFHHTCLYPNLPGSDLTDINKLYGFSEGFTEANSARLGWNCINGKLYVYPYIHANGVNLGRQDPPPIMEVQPGVEYTASIAIQGSNYVFTVNNLVRTVPKGSGSFWKFLLYHYFGGTNPAPHNMTITINQL